MKNLLAPVALLASLVSPTLAQCPLDALAPAAGASNDYFGAQFAVSGPMMVSSARLADDAGPDAGAAYFLEFEEGRFVEKQQVLPATDTYGQQFGRAVAIEGNRSVITSRDSQLVISAGAGFVYERSPEGWLHVDTLLSAFPEHAENIGCSVDLEGDRIVMGAVKNNLDEGHVLVFEKRGKGWIETARLRPMAPEIVRGFGTTVALSGDRLLIGANSSGGSVAAYVFELGISGWSQTARLQPIETPQGIGIGHDVALQGDQAILSLPHEQPGCAFVFEAAAAGTWTEVQKIVGSGDISHDFGADLDLQGDRLVVGGSDGSMFGFATDYVEVFRRHGSLWESEQRFTNVGGNASRGFGDEVRLWGDAVLVGSPREFGGGKVFPFNLQQDVSLMCDAAINSTGAAAQTSLGCGTTLGALSLVAGPVPDDMGLFFLGSEAAHIPVWDGYRCVGGTVFRLPIAPVQGGQLRSEVVAYSDLGGLGLLRPGDVLFAQAWFRDVAANGSGASLSTGLRIELAP